jgi:hypothetical protein
LYFWKICDVGADGVLDDKELNDFQVRCCLKTDHQIISDSSEVSAFNH